MEFIILYLYIALEEFLSLYMLPILFFGVIMVVIGIIGSFIPDCEITEGGKRMITLLRRLGFSLLSFILVLSLIVPSKQGMLWIIGGGAAYNIATSEEAKKLPDSVLKALNMFLEDIQEEEASSEEN